MTRLGLVCMMLLAGFGGAVSELQAQLLLEDFAAERMNGNSAPNNLLWEPTLHGNQTTTIANGRLTNSVTKQNNTTWYVHFYPHQGTPRYPHPEGFMKSYIKSGSWDPLINRMSFWIKCNPGLQHDEWRTFNVGTYVKGSSSQHDASQGAHYYHHVYGDLPANRWMKVVLTEAPTAQVSVSGSTVIPVDPEWQQNWQSFGRVHYFDGMTRFYVDLDLHNGNVARSCEMDDFYLWRSNNDPVEKVRGMSITYDGSRYQVAFESVKNQEQGYQVRYSSQSMKQNGFESGALMGNVESGGWAFGGVRLFSSAMQEQTPMYVAIRPDGDSRFIEVIYEGSPGSASPPPPQPAECDVNQDGSINQEDVDASVSAALGLSPCTADIHTNSDCDVVDTQRVVIAAGGGNCNVGP